MHTRNVNIKTATKESSRKMGKPCPEPKTASLIALYGDEVSYAWNVLEDLKVAGASYTRRNIIADMFRRLGVK
ncbi:hypothetical protein [Metakosakonia massiliensis]|uniref:Uncharacterized protein n=1 Tax=Phytobacter massiliensis TaxID=1485952 RepID=A0A6N3EAP0_9ENTR